MALGGSGPLDCHPGSYNDETRPSFPPVASRSKTPKRYGAKGLDLKNQYQITESADSGDLHLLQ